MPIFIKSLKFQIGLALLSLISLFFYFSLYTLSVLEDQRSYATLLRLAGELKVTYQHMSMQAMNYEENAPRDYETYYRDLKLYYQDLMNSMESFGSISKAFSTGSFSANLTLSHEFMTPQLEQATIDAAADLNSYWLNYKQDLQSQLGSEDEPRLEWAAQHISSSSTDLGTKTDNLLKTLERDILHQIQETNTLIRLAFITALALTMGIMLWFYLRVLRPLDQAVRGFQKVATGEFGYRVKIDANNEIGWMTQSFNLLSGRLDTIFGLSTRLQQGSDLGETLAYVSTALPELLPLDWVGALVVTDNNEIQLQQAYAHGKREQLTTQCFNFENSLLQECLNTGRPLHIPEVAEAATREKNNSFLTYLTDRHRHEAIFMPITEQTPVPVVLVFASRAPRAYQEEHLALLSNLSLVIALSFGRTMKLVEHGRLAAIGEFASSIAHEIRNPLATISLALDHFKAADLPENSQKRAVLASNEVARLNRLLEDMLLYAKPLRLTLTPVKLLPLIKQVFNSEQQAINAAKLTFDIQSPATELVVMADKDRLIQVILNLLRNALDAAPAGTAINVLLTADSSNQQACIDMQNQGTTIPTARLEKLFEPFFTTKPGGTGLGLSIVRRMLHGMGGDISAKSTDDTGITISMTMPLAELQ